MKPEEFVNMQERMILNQAIEIMEARLREVVKSDEKIHGYLSVCKNEVWYHPVDPEVVLPERMLTKDPECVEIVRAIRSLIQQVGILDGEEWNGWEDYAEGREELL